MEKRENRRGAETEERWRKRENRRGAETVGEMEKKRE